MLVNRYHRRTQIKVAQTATERSEPSDYPQILFLPGSALRTSQGVRARNDDATFSPVLWYPGLSAVLSQGVAPGPSPAGCPGTSGHCAPTGLLGYA